MNTAVAENFNGHESSDGGTVKNVSIGPLPKPAADARNNFLSATIQELGLYAVHQAP